MDVKRTGEFIQKRRKELGLSQKQLAERLDISPKTISKWETGRGLPDTGILVSLSEYMECSVDELLRGQTGFVNEEQNSRQKDITASSWKKYEKRKKYHRIIIGVVLCVLFVGSLTGGIISAIEKQKSACIILVCICIITGVVISIRLMSLRIRDWTKQVPVATEGMVLEKKIRISGGESATGYPSIAVRLYGDEKKILDVKNWDIYDKLFPGDLIMLTCQGFVMTECEVLRQGSIAQEAQTSHMEKAEFLKRYVKTVARWHHYPVADFRLENKKKLTLRVQEDWESPATGTSGELHWHGEYMDTWE